MKFYDDIKTILSRAVWAPSGDNSQPWKFEIVPNKLKIFNIPDRDNPILNFRQSGSYIAHGALIENICIIAPSLGYETEVVLFPQTSEPDLVAEITFSPIKSTANPLIDIIQKRCSNRRAYNCAALIPREVISEIKNLGNDEAEVVISEDKKELENTAKSLSQMEQIALENKGIHQLFFGSMFWDQKTNKTGKPGLFIKTLDLPLPMQYLFRLLRYWTVTRVLNMLGFSNLARIGNSKLYSQSAAHICIVIKKDDRESFIKAGRMTQRVWLKSTERNLSVQPVTGILFLGRKFLSGDQDGFEEKHVERAIEAYKKIKNVFKLGEDKTIAMFLRVGYAFSPSARSTRMSPVFTLR